MTLSSSVETLLVVEIIDRARLVFKKHMLKSVEDDPEGAFSFVSYGVLHNEDIRTIIHCNIEELGNVDILSFYTKHMMEEMGNLKPELK